MKKPLILFALLCTVGNLFAQDEKIFVGLKGGLNIASISGGGKASASFGGTSASVENKSKFLPHVGAYSHFRLGEVFALQPEILFSMKGGKYESKTTSGSSSSEFTDQFTLSYIDIPLQMRFNLKRSFILAGPYVGILVSAKYKSTSIATSGGTTTKVETESTSKTGLNTVEGGIYLGYGYRFDMGLSLSARWCRAFSNLYDNSGSGVNVYRGNNVWQFSVGYDLAKF